MGGSVAKQTKVRKEWYYDGLMQRLLSGSGYVVSAEPPTGSGSFARCFEPPSGSGSFARCFEMPSGSGSLSASKVKLLYFQPPSGSGYVVSAALGVRLVRLRSSSRRPLGHAFPLLFRAALWVRLRRFTCLSSRPLGQALTPAVLSRPLGQALALPGALFRPLF